MASATTVNPKTWNRYAYALNNPLRFTDPTGLKACWEASCSGTDDPTDGLETSFEEEDPEVQPPPQTPTPQKAIVVNGTPDEDALIDDGQTEIVRRVQTLTPCADIVGGADKGTKTITGTAWTIDRGMPESGHPQARVGEGTLVYVNPKGGMLTPDHASRTFGVVDPASKANSPVGFTITLQGAPARAFVMAHETAHKNRRFGKSDNDDYRRRDGLRNNFINNFKIWKACFPEVKGQPWTGGGLPRP